MSEEPLESYQDADPQMRAVIEQVLQGRRQRERFELILRIAGMLTGLVVVLVSSLLVLSLIEADAFGPPLVALSVSVVIGTIAGVATGVQTKVRRRRDEDNGHLSSRAVHAMFNKLDATDFSAENVKLRRDINREIRRVAKAVESIPNMADVEHPALNSAIATRVQGLLNLQVEIMSMHTPAEKRELHNQIAIAVVKFNAGAWVTLPEAEYIPVEAKVTLLRRIFYATLSVLFFGGLVTVIVFASNLGVAAPVLSILFTVAGISFLRAAGIMTQSVQEALDTAQKIYPTIKNQGTDGKKDEGIATREGGSET
ncbi:hypothetical protein [Rhodococcus sp. MEB064]|uniref:hypothetical protein n=1 Tax=Rhodococcus sp. MEB064 TaxID=1587522 RepID=UPI0012E0B38E|nr:hypothetical protein [Rhodococcus sp. MEB064]